MSHCKASRSHGPKFSAFFLTCGLTHRTQNAILTGSSCILPGEGFPEACSQLTFRSPHSATRSDILFVKALPARTDDVSSVQRPNDPLTCRSLIPSNIIKLVIFEPFSHLQVIWVSAGYQCRKRCLSSSCSTRRGMSCDRYM